MMNSATNDVLGKRNAFLRLLIAVGLILLVPLFAMQFTTEVNWDSKDFLAMGLLLLCAGSLYIVVSRKLSRSKRVIVALACVALTLYLWAELAVGVFMRHGS